MTNKLRLATLKITDPQALDRPLIASLLAHEARMANDPAIRERDRKINAELRAEFQPALVWGMCLGILLQLAFIAMLAWYFGVRDPALEFTIPFALLLAIVDFGIWRAVRNMWK